VSVLQRIAYFQGRRDERPNQDLARRLARSRNREAIREMAENLHSPNRNIQSDCLKVLYEIGYLKPSLIASYVDEFLDQLSSKHNRMVWGGMIALATVSPLKPGAIGKRLGEVVRAVEGGTLITVVWGVKVLAVVAGKEGRFRAKSLPVLKRVLASCLPRDVPMHAESILTVIDVADRKPFLAILEARQPELSAAQAGRLRKTLRKLETAAAVKRVTKR
jgi:hypothetical protein